MFIHSNYDRAKIKVGDVLRHGYKNGAYEEGAELGLYRVEALEKGEGEFRLIELNEQGLARPDGQPFSFPWNAVAGSFVVYNPASRVIDQANNILGILKISGEDSAVIHEILMEHEI